MQHRSAAPPPKRRHAVSDRPAAPGRRSRRRGTGRILRSSLITTLVTGLLLAVPVLSGAEGQQPPPSEDTFSLERYWSSWFSGSSRESRRGRDDDDDDRPSRQRRNGPVVVMGVDGRTAASEPTAAPSTAADAETDPGTANSTAGDPTTADAGSAPVVAATGGPFIAYSAESFFRRPLPAVTPVSPESATGVAFAWANDPSPYLKIRGTGGSSWGIAYAMADCSDPIYRISGNVPASQQHLRDVGFHAPASVWDNIPPSSDAPFLVIDRCGTSARPGGLSVWGQGTTVSGSTLSVNYAGSFAHDSNGLDRRNPLSDSLLNERSRGVIPDSMAIRVDLLDHAIRNGTGLGHVLEVFWVETSSAMGVVHPMVGAENGKAGWGAEGQRFRIKAGIDLASRPGCSPTTNPVGLAIARTLQQHGAYLGDNSGSGSGIKTEQNANYPGLNADSLRGCMTWDDIEFLPAGWDG